MLCTTHQLGIQLHTRLFTLGKNMPPFELGRKLSIIFNSLSRNMVSNKPYKYGIILIDIDSSH
jgi:hypothetical protein